MARYEVAIDTEITFHTTRRPFAAADFPEPETVTIEFEGRRFTWHVLPPENGQDFHPTVTTMIADANDYADERIAMERFLSAVAYMTRQKIDVIVSGAAGMPGELDPPVVRQPKGGFGPRLHEAPREVVVAEEARDRLRLVLGYCREAFNAASPYLKFLAFWMIEYPHLRGGDMPLPDDWWNYLWNERRGAIAHAIRDPDRPEDLDPDDPDMQGRFGTDARLLDDLVHMRVQERWGEHPVMRLRRREIIDGPA
jgi:hypothetical protein